MTVVALIQARMGSTRLPGKVMLPLDGVPVLTHDIRGAAAAETVETVVVATSQRRQNDVIERHARREGVGCFRGSETDVLGRLYAAARQYDADCIVRLCGDHPLVAPEMIDTAVRHIVDSDVELVSNRLKRTFPRGVAVEAFTMEAFATLERLADEDHRETVTTYYRDHLDEFSHRHLVADDVFDRSFRTEFPDLTRFRVVLDEPDDYERLRRIYEAVPYDTTLDLRDAVRYLAADRNHSSVDP